MEGHHAVDASLVTVGRPRNSLIGDLFGDVGLPGPRGERDLRLPVGRGVVLLVDALDALGEPTELLELRPLVVGDRDRYADVDALLDQGRLHRPTAVAPAPAEQVADLVLHRPAERLHARLERRVAVAHRLRGFLHHPAVCRDVFEPFGRIGDAVSDGVDEVQSSVAQKSLDLAEQSLRSGILGHRVKHAASQAAAVLAIAALAIAALAIAALAIAALAIPALAVAALASSSLTLAL